MTENIRNVQTSLLDKLIDDEPDNSREPVREHVSIGQIKDTVARDLENLLNARRHIQVPPVSLRQVNNSLFVYGLPDYTSRNPGNASVRSQLRLEIEKTISRFEPRLRNVAVHIDSRSENARDLGFRITAVLEVNPIAEPVTFDTSFDLNRSKYSILK
jgi:type VI secretion system protein ImpF